MALWKRLEINSQKLAYFLIITDNLFILFPSNSCVQRTWACLPTAPVQLRGERNAGHVVGLMILKKKQKLKENDSAEEGELFAKRLITFT